MQKIDKETEKKFLEAESFRNNDEFQKAIDIFEVLLKKIPNFPPILHNLALCHIGQNNFQEAEKFYLKCLDIEPVSILSINNLAKLYFSNKQFKKALPILKKSLLKNNNQEDITEINAICLFESQLKEETNIFCSEALKKFSQNRVIKFTYGKNLLRSNKHSEGLKYLKESSGMIEFENKDVRII